MESKRTHRQLLTFNSASRTAGTNETPTFAIQRELADINRVTVMSAALPLSYYAVNASNNVIDFTENAVALSATLTPGNYNTTTIQTELITQMNAVSAGVFTMSYDAGTYHLTWTNDTHTFVIDPASTGATLIGVSVAQVAALSQTSDAAVDLAGIQYIFIESVALGQSWSPYLVDGVGGRPILLSVPVCGSTGSTLFWKGGLGPFDITATGLTSIDFQLTTIDGAALDLNGLPWSIEVMVELADI